MNQIEILIAIYMIADRVIYCSSWYISTNTLNAFFFFLTTNRIDNNILIISIINPIVTVIAQIDCICKILIMINTTNGILIYIGYEDMPWLYIEYK